MDSGSKHGAQHDFQIQAEIENEKYSSSGPHVGSFWDRFGAHLEVRNHKHSLFICVCFVENQVFEQDQV